MFCYFIVLVLCPIVLSLSCLVYDNQWVLRITKEEGSFCIPCVRLTDSAQTIRVVSHLYRQITIA